MTINRVFCDANIILDLLDIDRGNMKKARELIYLALTKEMTLFTSCDVLSNIYYIAKKRVKKELLIEEMLRILDIFEIIEIDKEMAKNALVKNSDNFLLDFEDLLQRECATTLSCDLIVTNDKRFVKGEVKTLDLDGAIELFRL